MRSKNKNIERTEINAESKYFRDSRALTPRCLVGYSRLSNLASIVCYIYVYDAEGRSCPNDCGPVVRSDGLSCPTDLGTVPTIEGHSYPKWLSNCPNE